jgi:protein-S-isoprenylcysteine O-methyltransferase Ste14
MRCSPSLQSYSRYDKTKISVTFILIYNIDRVCPRRTRRIELHLGHRFPIQRLCPDLTNAHRLRVYARLRIRTLCALGARYCVRHLRLFRLKAFRELGKFCTFQLALLKDHQLVTTGPFALVRHPSYTGMTAVFWGSALAVCAPGSWTRVMLVDQALRYGLASGPAWLPWARGLGVVVLALQVMSNVGLVVRTGIEDEMLKREFGREWQAWAKQTPYKLVPGIY